MTVHGSIARALLAASLLASGCYYYYPKKVPDLSGTLLVESQPIKVGITSASHTSSCTDYELEHHDCRVNDYGELRHAYTLWTATATYGGRKLTHNEFYQLAMADYPERIRGIHDRKTTCEISIVPSAIAVAAAIAAIAVPLYFSTQLSDSQQKTVYYAAAGVTLGSSLLSYPLGGYACVKAKELGGTLLEDAQATEWESSDRTDLAEIETMATEFNAKHAGGAPIDDEAPATEGSAADEPATE